MATGTRTRRQVEALTLAEIAQGATDVDMPVQRRIVTQRKWDDNPFKDTLRELVEKGSRKGKSVVVPAHKAREVSGGIRDAAEKLTAEGMSTGVRLIFRYVDDDGNEVSTTNLPSLPDDDRNVAILYAARDRRR